MYKFHHTLKGHDDWVKGVAITEKGKIYSTSSDKTMRIWDTQSGKQTKRNDLNMDINKLILTADEEWVIMSCGGSAYAKQITALGGEVRAFGIWKPPPYAYLPHTHLVTAIATFENYIVTGSADKTLKVWDFKTTNLLKTLAKHSNSISDVAIFKGMYIVSASADKTLKIWNMKTWECEKTLSGHIDHVLGVAVSKNKDIIVSAGRDRVLKVWNSNTGKCVWTLTGHEHGVNKVLITDDDSMIVSVSHDETIKIWACVWVWCYKNKRVLMTGTCIQTLFGHSDNLSGVAITKDASTIVSASFDKTLRVWRIKKYVPTKRVYELLMKTILNEDIIKYIMKFATATKFELEMKQKRSHFVYLTKKLLTWSREPCVLPRRSKRRVQNKCQFCPPHCLLEWTKT
jgi:WD40 repeat protein